MYLVEFCLFSVLPSRDLTISLWVFPLVSCHLIYFKYIKDTNITYGYTHGYIHTSVRMYVTHTNLVIDIEMVLCNKIIINITMRYDELWYCFSLPEI